MVDQNGAYAPPGAQDAGMNGHELLARRRVRSAPVEPTGRVTYQERRRRPVIVGIGGTTRPDSTTLRALAAALRTMAEAGAETVLLGSADLDLPMYRPDRPERTPAARRLIAEVARADGLVIATPGYHGGISGLVKNALDYLEDLRDAPRPYLDGRAVGLIVTADGPQTAGTALTALRSTVHALRGWPTPLGVSIDTTTRPFGPSGEVADPRVAARLETLADQVMGFAYAWARVI